MPIEPRGRITVDLSALVRNWKSLANLVAPAACAGVVKADAYGLGAEPVTKALWTAGCRSFFVASCEEALALRASLKDARIFVLDGIFGGNGSELARANLIPVLSTLDHVAAWRTEANRRGRTLPAALQIDSGLNRLGFDRDEIATLRNQPDQLAGFDVQLVLSHLASADDPKALENENQRQAFLAHADYLPNVPRSLAASDGLMLGKDYHFDLVRPGYALYGGQAFRGRSTPVEPVVTVTAKILQVRTVRAGEAVGYSATYRATSDMRIAVIAAGYADGMPRGASAGNGEVHGIAAIQGKRVPVIGRVSMDLIALDVTGLPDGVMNQCDDVELIGPTVSLDKAGHNAGTIGYEILTRLSPRFARSYKSGGAA